MEPLDRLPKGKESIVDLKLPDEKETRKSLRQWVLHWMILKWPLWTELVGGVECRPHAPRGANSQKKNWSMKSISILPIVFYLRSLNFIHRALIDLNQPGNIKLN